MSAQTEINQGTEQDRIMSEQLFDANIVIDRLREWTGSPSDAELNRRLGLSRSAIAVWRVRNSCDIPLILQKFPTVDLNWLLKPGTDGIDEPAAAQELDAATMIVDRLKKYASVKTDGELSTLLGCTRSAVSNWKMRGAINFPLVFATFPEIDLNWLIRGESRPAEAPTKASDDFHSDIAAIRKDVNTMATMLAATFLLLSTNR